VLGLKSRRGYLYRCLIIRTVERDGSDEAIAQDYCPR
jgi:hypothetical protein